MQEPVPPSDASGRPHADSYQCPICGHTRRRMDRVTAGTISPSVKELIQARAPNWNPEEGLCLTCLNRFRAEFVQRVLETERGEITLLEQEVLDSLKNEEILAANISAEFESKKTFGEHVADKVAEFGGSWAFLISFAAVLLLWIAINTVVLVQHPFDPYPFILLNLVLSCLASVQAPVIMMSQNRQEAKDRLRAEHDYQVNLKAELEIRHLHAKLDQLLDHQWQHLLEIQQIQTELIQEISRRSKK